MRTWIALLLALTLPSCTCGTASCIPSDVDGGVCSDGTGGGGAGTGGAGNSGGGNTGGGSTGGGSGAGAGGGIGTGGPCPTGLQCNVACPGPTPPSTEISGTVYDPALKNGLYNVTVYVPSGPLPVLPKGVPVGASACSCTALFPDKVVVATQTVEDGTFHLLNAPVGTNVPLVIQIGKWRRLVHVNTTQCIDNQQPDKSIAFLGTVPAGDTDDNLPDIAVSTGSADTLECLMRRIGLPNAEYVAGAGGTGHVHVFSGGDSNGGNGVGTPEKPAMPNAPVSSTDLWKTPDQMMPYDIVLLSCEGGETYQANPGALETYLDNGGRVFASHFHYAWFAGPLDSHQMYAAPMDWGTHLSAWTAGGGQDMGPIGGVLDLTLNGSSAAFPKGVSLQKWLTATHALGTDHVPAGELAIYQPRYNSVVSAIDTPSQPWITSDASGKSGATMYLSFDTPVNAPAQPDGGPPSFCGRAVFSDLHVAGNPSTNDSSPPPGGCDDVELSPQEKALEFMLFDLSSCVSSDTVPPPPILQ